MNIIDFWKEFVSRKKHQSQLDKNEFLWMLNADVPDWRLQILNKEIWPDLHCYTTNAMELDYFDIIMREAGVEFAAFLVETKWGVLILDAVYALKFCAERVLTHWDDFSDFVKDKILLHELYVFLTKCNCRPEIWMSLTVEQKDSLLKDLEYHEKAYISDLLMFNIWSRELEFKKNPYVRFMTDHFKTMYFSVMEFSGKGAENRIKVWDVPVIIDEKVRLQCHPSMKLTLLENIAFFAGDEETTSRIEALKKEVMRSFQFSSYDALAEDEQDDDNDDEWIDDDEMDMEGPEFVDPIYVREVVDREYSEINKENLDLYYEEDFLDDVSNYFSLDKCCYDPLIDRIYVGKETRLNHLYPKEPTSWNESTIVPICYSWRNTLRDFMFSGIFAYLYVAQKNIAKYAGRDVVIDFNIKFSIPDNDGGPDVVTALKESLLAPTKAEAKLYLEMLDVVVPHFEKLTSEHIAELDHSEDIARDIKENIEYLRKWVAENTDEIVSFYGVLLRKEQRDDTYYDTRHVLLDAFVDISEMYDVYSFSDLAKTPILDDATVRKVECVENIVAHPRDVDFIIEYNNSLNEGYDERFLGGVDETPEEERRHDLYNTLINTLWEDEGFCKDGKCGLRDCAGRVIVPAEYEECIGGLSSAHLISKDDMVMALKKDGKWGFFKRNASLEQITEFKYDNVVNTLWGVFTTEIDGRFGIMSKRGTEMLPPTMLDIYKPTMMEGHVLYKHPEGYGFLLDGGYHSTEFFEEVDIHSGMLLSVCRAGEWGYIDEKAQFTKKRADAIVNATFTFESVVRHDTEWNEDFDMCDFDDESYLDEMFVNNGARMDYRDSSLSGVASAVTSCFGCVLFYTLLDRDKFFEIDMRSLYKLQLLSNGLASSLKSWEGYDEEKALLKKWLNERNAKSGVRNWAECIYAFNYIRNRQNKDEDKVFYYGEGKSIDFSTISDVDFDSYDFPEIEFEP